MTKNQKPNFISTRSRNLADIWYLDLSQWFMQRKSSLEKIVVGNLSAEKVIKTAWQKKKIKTNFCTRLAVFEPNIWKYTFAYNKGFQISKKLKLNIAGFTKLFT